MTLTEKASYLKGLLEGLNIDEKSENGKVFAAMADLLADITVSVTDLEDQTSIMGEELDLIEEALDEIDEVIDEIDDTLDSICEDEDQDEEYDEDEDEDFDFNDEEFYQVVCPTCGEEISVDEGILEQGKIKCPACGEDLEFDISELEDCDCDGECGEGCTCQH